MASIGAIELGAFPALELLDGLEWIEREILAVHAWLAEGLGFGAGVLDALERVVTGLDRKSTRLNSSHIQKSRMPSSA